LDTHSYVVYNLSGETLSKVAHYHCYSAVIFRFMSHFDPFAP